MNSNLIKHTIKKQNKTFLEVADALNITSKTLEAKINGFAPFKVSEIESFQKVCRLSNADIIALFF